MVVSTSISGRSSWSKGRRSSRDGTLPDATMNKVEEEVKRFQGNGLSLQMDSNHRVLEVTGNGCRITLAKNCGSVRVLGNGCSVKIGQNEGNIVYSGNGGRVLLGPDSSKENVKYVGNGGRISFGCDLRRTSSKNEKPSGTNTSNASDKKPAQSTDKKPKKDSGRDPSDLPKDKGDARSKEEIQNSKNERREARRSIRKTRKSDEAGNSKETVIVTRIVTSTTDDSLVRKWFADPMSVLRSVKKEIKDDKCVRIVSNRIVLNDKVKRTEEKR